jgi:hypothetical protein
MQTLFAHDTLEEYFLQILILFLYELFHFLVFSCLLHFASVLADD